MNDKKPSATTYERKSEAKPPAAGELNGDQLAQVTGGMNKNDLIGAIATNVNDAKPSKF